MSNVHYLAAVYPDLQWSADTDADHEEAGRWLSGLDHLFTAEELNLSGGMPPEGTLSGRLASRAFWQESDGKAAPLRHSPAARFSAWVLNDWLPLHLQYYHRDAEGAACTAGR